MRPARGGAPTEAPRRRAAGRPRRWATVAVAALVVTAAAVALATLRSGDGDARAVRLVDGSAPRPLPRPLRGLGHDAVLGRVRVARPAEIAGLFRSCVAAFGALDADDVAAVVHRVGAVGESLTFRDRGAPMLYACEASHSAAEPRGRWCGAAAGRLRAGGLTDPRLTLANCLDEDGETVAFAWVQPGDDARWLAVHEGRRRDLYETAGNLPVRVATTSGIDSETASAAIRITEYAADGRDLRTHRFEARVAG